MSTRNKVVVRRLPPNLPESIFWNVVEPWVTDDAVTWKSFHPGKPKSRPEKPNVPSRAYIVFKSADQVARFSREFDGHGFRDKQGNENFAVVEFAPFQKIPQERKKADARVGTIHQDDDFKSFLESLNSAGPTVDPIAPKIDPKSTPLLEALKAEKAAAKDALQIQSYHGHYNKSKAERLQNKAAAKALAAKAAIVVPSSANKALRAGAGATGDDEDQSVFSRRLNPDGTVGAAPAPVALLTKGDSQGKGKNPAVASGSTNAPNDNTTSPTKGGPPTTPKKKPNPPRVRAAQTQAQQQANPSSTPNSPKPARAVAAPILSKAPPQPSAVAPEGTTSTSTTTIDAPKPERERKKHAVNARMFEAALAGVGSRKRPGDREVSVKKDAVAVDPSASVQGSSSETPSAPSSTPTPAPAPTAERQPPNGPRGGAPTGRGRGRGARGAGGGAGAGRGSAPPSAPSSSTPAAVADGGSKTPASDVKSVQGPPPSKVAGGSGAAPTAASSAPSQPAMGRGAPAGRRGRGGRGRGRGAAGPQQTAAVAAAAASTPTPTSSASGPAGET